ncbi:transposase [Streptomyces sp. WZ.A104]|uniref:transposase n=1 Tax=Streptomyces sp. WZ.A104 TaxID=2023771 RepID=UPI00211CDD70|nr:transposase [Streptomyces sp. WZ.A104]
MGAERNERTDTRTALRNGHRDKRLTTQADDLDLAFPKLRSGSRDRRLAVTPMPAGRVARSRSEHHTPQGGIAGRQPVGSSQA